MDKVKNVEIVEMEPIVHIVSVSEFLNLKDKIIEESTNDASSFIRIGIYLNTIKELYKLEKFKDIYEFSKITFNFEVTPTKNFINVALKFSSKVKGIPIGQLDENTKTIQCPNQSNDYR